MANKRISQLTNTITAFRTGDYIAVDGTDTAKMGKDDLLKETTENTLSSSTITQLVGDTNKLNEQIFYFDELASSHSVNGYQLNFNGGATSVADGKIFTYNVSEGQTIHIYGTFKTTSGTGCSIIATATSGTEGSWTKSRIIKAVYSAQTISVDETFTITSGETKLFVSGYVGFILSVDEEISKIDDIEVELGEKGSKETQDQLVVDVNKLNGQIFYYGNYDSSDTTSGYQLNFVGGAIAVTDGKIFGYNVHEGQTIHVYGNFKTTSNVGCSIIATATGGTAGAWTKSRIIKAVYSAQEISVDETFTITSGETRLFVSGYVGFILSVDDEKSKINNLEQDPVVKHFYAYADGNYMDDDGTSFYGFDASNVNSIRRAIDAAKLVADKMHPCEIHCIGCFVADTSDKFIQDTSYRNFVSLYNTDYISIIGQGKDKTFIIGCMPDNLNINYAQYQLVQAEGNHQKISGITIQLKNGRYPVHIDQSSYGGNNDYKQIFENCRIVHNGNTGDALSDWSSFHAIGLGICGGQEITLVGCELVTSADPIYLHTNSNKTNGNPYKLELDSCTLKDKALGNASLVVCQSLFNQTQGQVIINGCSGSGLIRISESLYTDYSQSFKDVILDVDVVGNSNGLLGFDGVSGSSQLILKVDDVSSSHTLRMDYTSDGFIAIMKGVSGLTDFTDDYGRTFENGYAHRDGLVGRSAKCYGLKQNPASYGMTSTKTDQTLGKHLGDCSGTNKTLGFTLDGNAYSITLDIDYTSMSNSDVIAEINSKLTGITAYMGTISEEYYPMLDCVEWFNNSSGTAIIKGSCVSLNKIQDVKICNAAGTFLGIALDYIAPNESGRILTKGYLSSVDTDKFFARITSPNASKKYKPDSTGNLVEDVDGYISVTNNYDGTKKYVVVGI